MDVAEVGYAATTQRWCTKSILQSRDKAGRVFGMPQCGKENNRSERDGVVLTFPVPGHTYIPPDMVFRVIKKIDTIVTPEDYYNLFREHSHLLRPVEYYNACDWKSTAEYIKETCTSETREIERCGKFLCNHYGSEWRNITVLNWFKSVLDNTTAGEVEDDEDNDMMKDNDLVPENFKSLQLSNNIDTMLMVSGAWLSEVSMKQYRNPRAEEIGYPGENPPICDIVWLCLSIRELLAVELPGMIEYSSWTKRASCGQLGLCRTGMAILALGSAGCLYASRHDWTARGRHLHLERPIAICSCWPERVAVRSYQNNVASSIAEIDLVAAAFGRGFVWPPSPRAMDSIMHREHWDHFRSYTAG
ncbi:hypothetical protein PR048_013355 [Dryococelus australis]|uniref:Uncharacterized protein n=1 Tax=Dryococelus australis TaxID=614101 RepID=A0ABQ9HSQ0_9NEOP|nr:hypothetical protein PR048_013355 [Dryococelus australis]